MNSWGISFLRLQFLINSEATRLHLCNKWRINDESLPCGFDILDIEKHYIFQHFSAKKPFNVIPISRKWTKECAILPCPHYWIQNDIIRLSYSVRKTSLLDSHVKKLDSYVCNIEFGMISLRLLCIFIKIKYVNESLADQRWKIFSDNIYKVNLWPVLMHNGYAK